MTLPVVWLPEAIADLEEARAWYDNIGSLLGDRFALAVEATVAAITQHPLQFSVAHREVRRAGVRRFPYGIFFQVQESRILVIACFSRQTQSAAMEGAWMISHEREITKCDLSADSAKPCHFQLAKSRVNAHANSLPVAN